MFPAWNRVTSTLHVSRSHGPKAIHARFSQVSAVVRVLPLQMSREYEIRSGRRTVSIQHSVSALQAVVDYVRSFGCSDDEIKRLGVDTVAWRGARFSAVPVPTDSPAE